MNDGEPRDADLRSVLESVLEGNGGKWLRFISGILKNEADAEDVIQEAVQRVLVRNRYLPTQEQVRMYLGRAVGNAALELYNIRKRERIRQIPLQEQTCMPPASSSPHTYIEEREKSAERDYLLQMLDEGLARLPLKQHEALRLTILNSHGLSIRDVGITNGIPYSTLRHRSKQGLRRLRKFLQREIRMKRNLQLTIDD
jgi:RNA polymerase sigma factor (sigma-70 family)